MYDIVLVSVNLSDLRGRQPKYWSPPQGILYLAAMLEAHDCRVEVRDYQTADADDLMDADNLAAFIEADAPVLGVGCTSDTLPLAIAATRRFKERHPATRLILGGHGPTEVAEALLAAFPHVDIVARGEGEVTLLELMQRDGCPNDVPGVFYREGDIVKSNPPRPRLKNLDALPHPAYHHVNWDRYECVDVETARGCPYACAFCSTSPFFLGRYVPRSLDRVMAELELLVRRYGVRQVWFSDDTFVVNRRRVLDLCERLRAANFGICWGCYARIDLMDQALMEAMARAGCFRVYYGVESGSNRILRQLNKGITIAQAEEVVRLSTHYFAKLKLGFIWGLPFETMADFEATLHAAARFAALGPQIEIEMSLWTPFPSSTLYTQWGHLKAFSPDLVPMIGNWVPRDDDQSKTWREIIALIRAYPEIFAALYHVPHPNLQHKRDVLDGRAWLVEVLVGLAEASAEFATQLRENSEAGLQALRIKSQPVAGWAAAQAAARLKHEAPVPGSAVNRR